MQAQPQQWRVENYQVPVPLGDCSIHLLIELGWNQATKEQTRTIKKAFIMDGGTNGSGVDAHEMILLTLKEIDRLYGTEWRLDSWVVTHWDLDHYHGTLKLLGLKTINRNTVQGTFRNLYFHTDRPVRLLAGADPEDRGTGLYTQKGEESRDLKTLRDLIGTNGFHCMYGERLIGMDLFTLDRTFIPSQNRAFQLGNDCQPRFGVVGADGWGPSNRRLQDDPSKNETCILALLYWPNGNHPVASYFTGGDGNPDVELSEVIPWMNQNHMEKVSCFKLDHHGSSKENFHSDEHNKTVLHRLQPKHVLVTPGHRYGHPTWDILRHLKEYFRTFQNGSKGLYTTREPYWMSPDAPATAINLGHHSHLEEIHLKTLLDYAYTDKANYDGNVGLAFEAEEMKSLDKEYGDVMKEFVKELRRQTPPGKKLTYQDITECLVAEENALRERLGEILYDGSANEPVASDRSDLFEVVMNYRHWIVRNATREHWPALCAQKPLSHTQPFFLLVSYFDNGGQSTGVDWKPMDVKVNASMQLEEEEEEDEYLSELPSNHKLTPAFLGQHLLRHPASAEDSFLLFQSVGVNVHAHVDGSVTIPIGKNGRLTQTLGDRFTAARRLREKQQLKISLEAYQNFQKDGTMKRKIFKKEVPGKLKPKRRDEGKTLWKEEEGMFEPQ